MLTTMTPTVVGDTASARPKRRFGIALASMDGFDATGASMLSVHRVDAGYTPVAMESALRNAVGDTGVPPRDDPA